jgi:Cu(I)/Ag(I) efflux system membrane fusion protein
MTRTRWAPLAALALTLQCANKPSDDHGGHTPAATSAAPAQSADPHAGHAAPAASAPAGYAPFTLAPGKAEALGLATVVLEERDFDKTLRTVGSVVLDETRTSHVHAKIRGWIEKINVDFVGKPVRAGAALCSIFSQEVYAGQLEFLSVLQQVTSRPAPTGTFAQAEARAQQQLLDAARQRLKLWDVSDAAIQRLERTREAQRTFTLVAPRSGVVVAKQAIAGMYVDPNLELYLISDTRRLWVLADVYETDVPFIKIGTEADLEIEGVGAERRSARISFIPPSIAEATRTLRVRFDLDNADGRIRPGAYATVKLRLPLGRALAVPEEAVIRTGQRSIVFVLRGERVEPREVHLGPLVAGHYRVEHGLAAGDRVAIGAQFLMDSESRLRATSGPVGHAH